MERIKRAWNLNSTLITVVMGIAAYEAVKADKVMDQVIQMKAAEDFYFPRVDALELDMRDVQTSLGIQHKPKNGSPKEIAK